MAAACANDAYTAAYLKGYDCMHTLLNYLALWGVGPVGAALPGSRPLWKAP